MNSSESAYSLTQTLRHAHSVSLMGHSSVDPITGCPKVHVHSSKLLQSRKFATAIPAIPVDNCEEVVNEVLERRRLHSRVLERDPSAFKKRNGPETTSSLLHEGMVLNDFLSGMHGLKDQKDLDASKVKRVVFSRRKEIDAVEKEDREETLFNSLPPIEDFIRPRSSTTPRQTGYDSGHIRSLLKSDTFGPASSSQTSSERTRGLLPPHSPNVDRFRGDARAMTLSRSKTLLSRAATRSHPPHTANSAATSSVGSVTTMKDLFHDTSNVYFDFDGLNRTGSGRLDLSGRPSEGTLGYHGPAYSSQERLLVDPLLKRNTWHKSYVQSVKDRQREDRAEQQRREQRRSQAALARTESQAILAFEKHLVLAKHQVS